MIDIITPVAACFGWTVQAEVTACTLYNANGKKVCTVKAKNGRFQFRNTDGLLICSGVDLAASVENVLEKYYYAKKVTRNEKPANNDAARS